MRVNFLCNVDFCLLVALLMSKVSFLILAFVLVRLARTGLFTLGSHLTPPELQVPASSYRSPPWGPASGPCLPVAGVVRSGACAAVCDVRACTPGTRSSHLSVPSRTRRGVALDSRVLRTEAARRPRPSRRAASQARVPQTLPRGRAATAACVGAPRPPWPPRCGAVAAGGPCAPRRVHAGLARGCPRRSARCLAYCVSALVHTC